MDKKSTTDNYQSSAYPFAIRFFNEIKALGVTEVAASPKSKEIITIPGRKGGSDFSWFGL